MRNYYRVMLGEGSELAAECFANNFIGTDYEINQDLSGRLYKSKRDFNRELIPIYMAQNPGKSKIGAGQAMGALWTVSKGILIGDMVLCPNGSGYYHVGEVIGDYSYAGDATLFHRRPVRWLERTIAKTEMTEALRGSLQSQGAAVSLSKHASEIERLLTLRSAPLGCALPGLEVGGQRIVEPQEDPVAFALEKHLEEFLVENWKQTELGKDYVIYEDEGKQVGKQFPTETGFIDILAISRDKKRLLVVELKRGRASDAVVGQVLRYMGDIKEDVAEDGQEVRGVIIAQEDDERLRRAISFAQGVEFFRYQVSFKLHKV